MRRALHGADGRLRAARARAGRTILAHDDRPHGDAVGAQFEHVRRHQGADRSNDHGDGFHRRLLQKFKPICERILQFVPDQAFYHVRCEAAVFTIPFVSQNKFNII